MLQPHLRLRIAASCWVIVLAAGAFCLLVHTADASPILPDDTLRAAYEARVAQAQETVTLLKWGASVVIIAMAGAVSVLYRALSQMYIERRDETIKVTKTLTSATSALDCIASAMRDAPCMIESRSKINDTDTT